jgi:hypothetical protein
MRIYLDIETTGTTDPATIREIEQGIQPPGNISKAETIAKWHDEKRPLALAEAVRKTALDAASGSIISIAWATGDADPICLVRDPAEPTDKPLLEDWLNHLHRQLKAASIAASTDAGREVFTPDPFFVAHNATFDLGFLYRRLIVNCIIPPFRFPGPASWRYGRDYACTMVEWAGFRDLISLDKLCRALNIPSPKADGVDGKNVGDLWKAGDLAAVRKYNTADVEAVRAIYARMEGAAGRAA